MAVRVVVTAPVTNPVAPCPRDRRMSTRRMGLASAGSLTPGLAFDNISATLIIS
jgi:hypothetical protein